MKLKKKYFLLVPLLLIGLMARGQCGNAFTGILENIQIEFSKCIDDPEKAVDDAYDFVDINNSGADDYQNPNTGSFFINFGDDDDPDIQPINYNDLYKRDCDDQVDGEWQPLVHMKNLADMADGYAIASNEFILGSDPPIPNPYYNLDKANMIAQ